MTTPVEVVERIAELALLHPVYGCNRLEAQLALEGRRLSAITSKGSSTTRAWARATSVWLALERKNAEQVIESSAPSKQRSWKSLNPASGAACRKRAAGSAALRGHLMVGTLNGIGRVYLHAVADTFVSYALGFLHVSKQAEAAVAVLHNHVLPFYAGLDPPISAVLTDIGREFLRHRAPPHELYPALNDIAHRKTRVGSPRTNGFVERFKGAVLEEFFRPTMRSQLYESVEALQADLDA